MPSDKRQRQRERGQARQAALAAAQQKARRRNFTIVAIAIAVLGGGAIAWAVTHGSDDKKATASATTSTTVARTTTSRPPLVGDSNTCPPDSGTSKRFTKFPSAPKMCIDATKTYKAVVKTDVGDFTITLNAKTAPNTVNSFVFLARNHFYDGITFHRVIPDFVDQTGDPQGTGAGGPGYQYNDEIPAGYQYKVGDVAMANSGPNTNGSQFFITVSQNGASSLLAAKNGVASYTPFGTVTDGMDVVTKINGDGTQAGSPTVIHKMTSVKITEE